MTKIYLIRHCQGTGNVEHIFSGTTDTDISELGEKQLKYVTKRFEGIHVDAVYSSPLIRAKKTAHAVADISGLRVTADPGFIEVHGGIVEGRPFAESFHKYPEFAPLWKDKPQDFAIPDCEPMRNAYERIFRETVRVARENEGKTVVIASHGGVIRCLLARLLYGGLEKLPQTPWSENTAVTYIEADDEFNLSVKYYNDYSHLPDELMPESSKINSYINGKKKD